MNPYLSWAILLIVAGGLGWYYNGKSQSKTKVSPARAVVEKSEQVSAAKKPKRQPKKAKETSPSALPAKQHKQELRVNTAAHDEPDNDNENDMDNLQFAKEFAKAQAGSTLGGSAKDSKKAQKKAKTQRIKHGDSKGMALSTSASSTGAEADDDMSPVDETPVAPVTAGNVSDMLEPAEPSASVLRITGAEEKKKQKQEKKEPKPAETKKQRQARLKREKQRAMVQEAEKERRDLQEKQLHSAREHERREAAKSTQHAPDAWKKTLSDSTNANGVKPAATTTTAALLDTFDETPSVTSTQTKESKPASSGSTEKSWAQDLPSEEEQMRMLNAINSDDDWTTVPSKKEKKAKQGNKSGDNMSEVSETASVRSIPAAVKPKSKPKKKKSSNAATPVFQPSTVPIVPPSIAAAQKAHPLDSDWTA